MNQGRRIVASGLMAAIMLLGGINLAGAEGLDDYAGHWAEGAAEVLTERGYMENIPFFLEHPDQPVTRAEFIALMDSIFQLDETNRQGNEQLSFTDVEPEDWFYDEVYRVAGAGISLGYNGNMRPDALISREEAAVSLVKALYLELPEDPDLTRLKDAGQISAWSARSVGAMVNAEYMKGFPDQTWRPKAMLTRAEALAIMEPLTVLMCGCSIEDANLSQS